MLETILNELLGSLGSVAALRYVAADWGQLKLESPPVQWPCALVSVDEITYSYLVGRSRQGRCSCSVLLANVPSQLSSSRNPVRAEQASAFLSLVGEVEFVLHGLSSACHTPLALTSCRRMDYGGLEVYELSLTTSFTLVETTRNIPVVAGITIDNSYTK